MKPYIRSILTALITALFLLLLSVYVLAPRLPWVVGWADVKESRSFSWPNASLLRLDNRDGFIRVVTNDTNEITAQAEIRAYTRGGIAPEDVQAYVDGLISATESDGHVDVVTEPAERPDPIDLVVTYTIAVPVGADIEITTANGNVWVAKGCGNVSIRGRNTDIQVWSPQGHVIAETINGRIMLQDVPAGARVQTVNGSILVWMLGGAFQAGTTNGNIEAYVLKPGVESCELNSQNGTIRVILNQDCTAQVIGRTERGIVESHLPVDTSAGVNLRRRLEGAIGEGHTLLTLGTLNGNIRIARGNL